MTDIPHNVRAINKACRTMRGRNVYIAFEGYGAPYRVINAKTQQKQLYVKLLADGLWHRVWSTARIYEA